MITRSDLALLGVRLLALYLIVEGIGTLAGLGTLWSAEDPFARSSAVWISLAMAVPVALGGLLLLLSRPLAARLLPEPREEPPPRASTVQSIAIGTFGLFLIATSIPATWVDYLTRHERTFGVEEGTPFYENPYFLGHLLTLAIGIALFTGAAYWTRLFTRFRNLGHDPNDGRADD